METVDLYQTLELSRECTQDEIKTSYKKLALKWHPDKNKGNEEEATVKFQKVSEAYSILSDPDKKARYDKYGTLDDNDFDFQDFMSHFDFQDIFGGLFGGPTFTFSFGGGGFGGFGDFGDFGAFGGGKMPAKERGRMKNKHMSKAQIRKQQKQAQKLFKEFAQGGFNSDSEDEEKESKKKQEKKTQKEGEESDGDWDTEEEYTDGEEEDKAKPAKNPENGKEEENDDDFEDVDSEEDEDGGKDGDDDEIGMQDVFLWSIFVGNSSHEQGKKVKCKLDKKIFKDDEALFDHFDKEHKKDFKVWMKNNK